MKHLLAAILILSSVSAYAQKPGDYINPVDIPVLLSGGFAEMRPDHFHSGIDFKTGGQEGVPLRAVADGYVVRIAASPTGYGRALYIAHPNGTISVYAHMQRFTPEIEEYLTRERYQRKSDQVDLTPPTGKFKFNQGDTIGLSGNSGSSAGPHLHFEIRQSSSQRTLNSVARGYISVRDNIKPNIFKLFYIRVDTISGVPVNSPPKQISIKGGTGSYTTVAAEIAVAGNGYFAIETIDRMNDTPNTMGIYMASQSIDGEVNIEIKRDGFLFSDTRYINAMAHYGLKRNTSNEVIRMAVLEGNKLPMYSSLKNRGAVVLTDTLPHPIAITLTDDCGNCSRIDFMVRRSNTPAPQPLPSALIVRRDKTFRYASDSAGIVIPDGALYESAFFNLEQIEFLDTGRLSPVYSFMDEDTPLHTAATIWIVADIPSSLRGKATLASVSSTGKLSYAGGSWAAANASLPERITAQLREFGRYCVVVDTIAPTITPIRTASLSQRGSIKISDDFSGIKFYRATIDGHWALMEYDQKNKMLHYSLDTERSREPGEHEIELTVTDRVGNRSVRNISYTIN